MPDSPILQAAATFRAQLLAKERAAATRLVSAYGQLYQRLQANIKTLEDAIAALPEPTAGQIARLSQFKTLRRQIEQEVARYAAFADVELQRGADEALRMGLLHARQLTLAGVPAPLQAQVSALYQHLNADAVRELLGFLGPDSPLQAALARDLGPAVAQGVADKLLEGVGLGFNPRKVAATIRRELGQGLTWSLRTARTAQLWSYREASRASYVANAGIVQGWQWTAALDNRTCLSCVAKHGTVYPPDAMLNDHHNGRCGMTPITVSWRDLGIPIDNERPLQESGTDWFARQPEATQRQMMGAGKYEAWKQGKFQFGDLSTRYTDPVYGEMMREASLKDLLGPQARAYYGRE